MGVQWGGREGAGCVWSTGVGLGVQLVNLNVIRAHDGAILPPLSKCGTERSYNTHKKTIVSYSLTHTPHIHWSFLVYNYEQTTNSVLEEARILFLNPRQPHIPSQRPRHTLPPSSLTSYHPTVHLTTNPPRPPTAPGSTPPGNFLVRNRTITISPELWVASDWPATAVIAPRGPPEGGRWSGQIGLSYPSKPGTRARQCRPPKPVLARPCAPPASC